MTRTSWKYWQATRALLVALSALAIMTCSGLVACDPGAEVTYVNSTDIVVEIYLGDDEGDRAVVLPPHSSQTGVTIKAVWEDVVVVRDQAGNILLREEITWDELKARGYRYVVEEEALTPAPGMKE